MYASILAAGIFSFSSSSYTFPENAGLVSVKVVRTGGASGQVQVLYRLANPTQATAVNNKNFRLSDSVYQVQFNDGQREGFISFTIINDAVYETNEFFYLEILSTLPTKASDSTTGVGELGTIRTAIIFIADDGDAGVFNFASPFIFCREDSGSALLTVIRSVGSSSSSYMPVNLVISTLGTTDGSNATEGGSLAFDYLAKSDKLNWANGELTKTFAVQIFNNNRYQKLTRAVKVKMLSVEGGASIGTLLESWIYIIDDRDAGTFSFQNPSYEVLESRGSVTVKIVRTGVIDSTNVNTYASGAVTVDVATYAGTVLPGKDRYDPAYDYGVVHQRGCTQVSPCTAPAGIAYTALQSTTIAFADGVTSKTVTIPIVNDDLFQAPDRVFKVTLKGVTGGAHIGIDYEHPSEWFGYRDVFLALETQNTNLLDNVGTIVTIKDDGDPAVLVSKASLSTSEIGQFDTFQVWLNSQPSADVTLSFAFDSALLGLSLTTLVFTATNWNVKQLVKVTAVPSATSEGLHMTQITLACASGDSKYAAPFRTASRVTGSVLAVGVYTQLRGVYETGNLQHQFLWSEVDGIMTAPRADSSLAVFIFDNKHVGVTIRPETIRHSSGVNPPDTFVSVRRIGHSATISISLTSQPIADVQVALIPNSLSGVAGDPASLLIGVSRWEEIFTMKIVAVAITGQAEPDTVQFSTVSMVVTSTGDPRYNRPNNPVSCIFVQRFPPALALLDSSVATIREGAGDSEMVLYSLSLGSEPMHWEPAGQAYSPYELVLSADADTTLYFSVPSGVAGSGTAPTITVAGNSTKSTNARMVKSLGVLRFKVYPDVVSSTGSSQVGSARLRLYRVSGGENGGLGGIQVGVRTASMGASDDWDESGLQATCSSTLENNGVCSVVSGTTSLPSFFPAQTTIYNINAQSDGETLITPSGTFDATTNSYTATSGWLEIDVTYAVNKFLSAISKSSTARAITLLIYSRSTSEFTYDGVDEVVFASRDHSDSSLQPQLRMTSSGTINLALKALVSQSCPGNAKAAIDGNPSSKLSSSASYALSSTPYKYPWWEADLTAARAIEDIVITVKRKPSTASMDASYLDTSFWVFLSTTSLVSNNNGLDGFTTAKAAALYVKQFNVTTRSFTAAEADTITFRWQVNGEKTGAFNGDRFVGDYTEPVVARFVLIQVAGENNIMLNEVEIYQQAFASSRVSISGFLPSLSQSRLGMSQLQLLLPGVRDADLTDCDAKTAICRRELLFTSGNWKTPQLVGVKVIDDVVAMGDHDIYATHTLESNDPDFDEASQCGVAVTSSGSLACKDVFFNETAVKPIRVLEDDENAILLSTHKLELIEGSRNFPTAPVYVRQTTLSPAYFRCSSSADLLNATANLPRDCMASFSTASSSPWETCIANSSAAPLEPGSAWMMAGFTPGTINISRIDVTVPRMVGAQYIKRFSVYWSSTKSLTEASTRVFDLSNGWEMIKSVDVTMQSSGIQSFVLDKLALFPAQALLVTLEKSYDDTKQCVLAPQVRISGSEPVPFPLSIRGNLTATDSVPPSLSHLSRMHLYGKSAVIQVKLASEPIADVVVSAVLDNDDSVPVVAFDAANTSAASESVRALIGLSYESGKTWAFTIATAIKFTPMNWNVSQELTFAAVDDNFFKGNRTFSISHAAESSDGEEPKVPHQSFDGINLDNEPTTLSNALSYAQAKYIVSDRRLKGWPLHYDPAWSSSDGEVEVTVIDDDLPGVTISTSIVKVSESGPSGNFSVFLDSAPSENVVVKVSFEKDDALFIVMPLQLKFTTLNWYEPQFVFVHPVSNSVYDGEQPFTVGYERLIPKATKPILALTVESADTSYTSIKVGDNEFDRKTLYVVNQGVQVVIQDDDTGCLGEYACQRAGVCMNSTSGNVCKCPENSGMRDCSASCESKRACEFSRVAFRLKCLPEADNAICRTSFSAATLATTLYRMLSTSEFTAANGEKFAKLTNLRPMSELLYVVNSSRVECVDGSGACVSVWLDLRTTDSDGAAVQNKLNGFLASGSLKTEPFYAELMTTEPQYPADLGSTIAVWIFIGFCTLCVTAVGVLFTARLMRAKTSHVTPQLNDDGEPVAALTGVALPHATERDSTEHDASASATMTSPRST